MTSEISNLKKTLKLESGQSKSVNRAGVLLPSRALWGGRGFGFGWFGWFGGRTQFRGHADRFHDRAARGTAARSDAGSGGGKRRLPSPPVRRLSSLSYTDVSQRNMLYFH